MFSRLESSKMIPLSAPHDFYDTLPEPARSAIDAASRYRGSPKGSLLIRQGGPSDQIHQFVTGAVKFVTADGKLTSGGMRTKSSTG